MSLWAPAPPPPTKLGRYRQLCPSAGLHVSPICLGAMSIGDKWEKLSFGAMNKDSSFKLLDAFYDAGGNFIDTANSYQAGTSEEFIGEWAEQRGIRDQLVIATKYTTNSKREDPNIKITANYVGNHVKNMHVAVNESLKRLRTSYIDIFYVHWYDFMTPMEEVMSGLHNLIVAGKVLYLGVSDAPAWYVAKANQWARDHGKTPFVIYQGQWNVWTRDFEREIIPMARAEGMALAPWDVLASGKIRTDEEEERRRQTGEKGRMLLSPNWERDEKQRAVCKALEQVAGEVGASSIQAVAIAYVMQKTPFVFPIVGGRKVEHLHANLGALDVSLSPEQIKFIESHAPFEPGFPYWMTGDGTDFPFGFRGGANFDKWPLQAPIRPTAGQ